MEFIHIRHLDTPAWIMEYIILCHLQTLQMSIAKERGPKLMRECSNNLFIYNLYGACDFLKNSVPINKMFFDVSGVRGKVKTDKVNF